jgi:integrase
MTALNSVTIAPVIRGDLNPAAIYLASLGPGSLPGQRSALKIIARIAGADLESFPWGELRYQHVMYVRARLQENYAPATANRILSALRSVLHHAWILGYLPDVDYRRMELKPIKAARDDTEDELAGRSLGNDELRALLEACQADKSPAGPRDACVIALGYGLGLRRCEISKLDLADYNQVDSLILVRSSKGNKSRTLPVGGGALAALEGWLIVRGPGQGPMFRGVNKGGDLSSMGLSTVGVSVLYHKRVATAGIATTHFHDLRRSFISDLLDAGVDLVTVSRLAGHSDPRTTARYDRRRIETRRRAIAVLQVPYISPGANI